MNVKIKIIICKKSLKYIFILGFPLCISFGQNGVGNKKCIRNYVNHFNYYQ